MSMKMLVVDDDLASLGTLCTMLRTKGYTVDTANSAEIGIRMMRQTPYDVIFLDYNMPGHNGEWFIRNAPVPPETSVILVSGFLTPMAMANFRQLGIEVMIKKPFTLVALQGCLNNILDAA